MKILQLFGGWRWTGPAEPVFLGCVGLAARGHEVVLAHAEQPPGRVYADLIRTYTQEAPFRVTTELPLQDLTVGPATLRGVPALHRFLARERFDVVHTHHDHDQVLAAVTTRLPGLGRPLLVRSIHHRDVWRPKPTTRALLAAPHGVGVFTDGFRTEYLRRFRLPESRLRTLTTPVDLDRFTPRAADPCRRTALGLPPNAPAIGIVSKPQTNRAFEVIWDAAARVVAHRPDVRFVVLGEAWDAAEAMTEPVSRRGIAANVIAAGYHTAADGYADLLACFDLVTLLIPGTDGTARAVREAMAMGIPCVVSNYGMLPEIIEHGRTGLVVPRASAGLAAAWLTLIDDPRRRQAMGRSARDAAVARFSVERTAEALETAYRDWGAPC